MQGFKVQVRAMYYNNFESRIKIDKKLTVQ